jgi:hypothetical protein
MRLFASTKKTGRLRVSGDRGEGSVWVDGGTVVAASSSGSGADGTAVDVVFELLRYSEGSFTFEAGSMAESAGAPTEVEPLLTDAENQLVEWREIEKVVPSIDAWVVLSAELPGAEIMLDAPLWRTIVSVGSGTTVASIGQALGLAEVAVCRRVKDLVEMGLGAVLAPTAEQAAPPAPAVPAPVETAVETVAEAPVEPIALVPEAPAEPLAQSTESFRHLAAVQDIEVPWAATTQTDEPPKFEQFSADLLNPSYVSDDAAEDTNAASALQDALRGVPDAPMGFGPADDEAVDADEVARQLASLSPKAARAVAAAARAETMEEREAALEGVTGEDDEPINRGLLLKFLSSVRS